MFSQLQDRFEVWERRGDNFLGFSQGESMKLWIISWNVRGINVGNKRSMIKSLICLYSANLVCLQETKVQQITTKRVGSLGVGRCLDWGAMDARGQAGGIVVFWDKWVLELHEMEVGAFSVSCRFTNCEGSFVWMFSGVYGPILIKEREDFWAKLGAIRGLWRDPWCIGGDFNVVRFLAERGGCLRMLVTMRCFSEVIDELGIKDLTLSGGEYTWCGGLNNNSTSRLDRFLVSDDWEDQFSGLVQKILPNPTSDHAPILLDRGGIINGKFPFRFENMWLKEEGFKDLIRCWWEGYSV